MDKVNGLDLGASDYITKPFHIEELLARIRAALRKRTVSASAVLSAGDLSLDTVQRTVTRGGSQITLTKTHYELLEYMLRSKNIVFTRDRLLDEVWGYHYAGGSNIVDVYVRYVRNKIGDSDENRLIETVRGVGYVIRDK